MHPLIQLFPDGTISEVPSHNQAEISIAINASQWFNVSLNQLSEREIQLIKTLQQQNNHYQMISHTNPWQEYITGHRQDPPQIYQYLQLIYIDCQVIDSTSFSKHEWIDTLLAVLPNCFGHFSLSKDLSVFIIDGSNSIPISKDLEHYLLPIEDDFAVHMTIFSGNYWSKDMFSAPLFTDELKMVQQYLTSSNRHKFIPFNKLLFWYLLNGYQCPSINTSLLTLLHQQEAISSIIEELWQQKGILTKTAQNLFLHRNTLQYRIDKFYELTGLSLKSMDDLALCYLILHRDTF
ncbi:PucR C-terminal helix-turn-helix domain-containing protein [Granulicatella balaenopterae]|uniref:PucR C-terminal helix-turn-helix domain-containing protein n=1 Tax=Granulicatella balaenopterae TaxID=137733 RepID=A0A1H9LCD4_9LACT|nr:helix-turn-helix domain-containing protein [Granulicatella balaenopterae]SER08815.1 PucR C-terminal helix-turn-helix domain-containing protein [Granulicatella balaenopterae]